MLHLAVQYGMTRVVRELLDMGIDHTALDRNNKTGKTCDHNELDNTALSAANTKDSHTSATNSFFFSPSLCKNDEQPRDRSNAIGGQGTPSTHGSSSV